MKNFTLAFLVVGAAAFATSQAVVAQGQSSTQSGTIQSTNQELYHVHIVKAAPGRLNDLINAYVSDSQATGDADRTLILRHLEGDDWDLVVVNALGKQETLSATPSKQDVAFAQRTRPLRDTHSDTFALGSPWSDMRTALIVNPADQSTPVATSGSTSGTGASSGPSEFYVVTTMRALPGHRDQLWQVLQRIAAADAGRSINMSHLEGAAWDFMSITRYNSLNELNEMGPAAIERYKAQGFGPSGPPTELREHMAEHHDTICYRIAGTAK